MPADEPLVYWDANVFLSFVNALPERISELESILDASRRGEIRVVTSTVSIVEVAYGAQEQSRQTLSLETEDRIAALWTSASPILPVEFHELLAEEARSLVRRGLSEQRSLKPMDAIHLATARRLEVRDFHTYDGQLQRWTGFLGFPVREPVARTPKLPGA